MPSIHLVERLNNVHKIQGTADEWESGQNEPSHFGEKILGYRIEQGGEVNGRFVFHIRATIGHKGIRAGREGWGNEKKLLA